MTFPIHLVGMLRMCGALTVPGLSVGKNVMINNMLPALEGDRDSHTNLGMLINVLLHNVMIGGIPAIPSIISQAAPDVIGITPHVKGFPIPITGSPNVMIGMGSMGAVLGIMNKLTGGLGSLQVGELVSIGGQVLGTVSSFTAIGGSGAVAQISGLTPGLNANPGQQIVGQTSGNYLTTVLYVSGTPYESANSITNAIVTDSGDRIVVQTYLDYYPAMNLTSAMVTT